MERLKLIEEILSVARKIDLGLELPSSSAGDFLNADGVEVTHADLYDDV